MNNKFAEMRMANKASGQLASQETNLTFKVTHDEAVEFIKKSLGLPEAVKVIIEYENPAIEEEKNLDKSLKEKFCDKIAFYLDKDEKINAIKYARSVLKTGLAESKEFVDRFEENEPLFLNGRHKYCSNFDRESV